MMVQDEHSYITSGVQRHYQEDSAGYTSYLVSTERVAGHWRQRDVSVHARLDAERH